MSLATRGTGHKPWLFAALCCQLLCLKPAWVILRSGERNPLPGGTHSRVDATRASPPSPCSPAGRDESGAAGRAARLPGRAAAPLRSAAVGHAWRTGPAGKGHVPLTCGPGIGSGAAYIGAGAGAAPLSQERSGSPAGRASGHRPE